MMHARLILSCCVLSSILLLSPAAFAQTASFSGPDVRAVDATGAALWTHTVVPTSWLEEGELEEGKTKADPIVVAGHAVYCLHGTVYETRMSDGVVQHHFPVSMLCDTLEARGQGYVVSGRSAMDTNPLPKDHRTSAEIPGLGVGTQRFAFIPGGGLFPILHHRLLATSVYTGESPSSDLYAEDMLEAWKGLGVDAELERAIGVLEERARQDPTNPHFHSVRGEYLLALGRTDEAARAFDAALAVDDRYAHHLLQPSMVLDGIDQERSNAMFERATKSFLEHGFEPELNSLVWLAVHQLLIRQRLDLTKDADLERALRFAGRLQVIAPRVEASSYFYAGLVDELERRGDDRAERWRDALEVADGFRGFGVEHPDMAWAMHGLTPGSIAILVVLLLLVLKLLRGYGRTAGDAPSWIGYNGLSRAGIGEILGLIGVFAASLYIMQRVVRGVAIIGIVAAMPISVFTGGMSHPEARAYIEKAEESDARTFFLALSHHQAGDLDAAEPLYRALTTSPMARNNLGVLLHQKGDEAGAKAEWEAVWSSSPEAEYNLTGDAKGSARVDRYKRFDVSRKLLSVPDHAMTVAFFDAQLATSPSADASITDLFALAEGVTPDSAPMQTGSGLGIYPLWVLMLVALLALAAMVRRPVFEPTTDPQAAVLSKAAWGLSLLIPGSSRRLFFVGPFIAWLMLTAFVSGIVYDPSDPMPTASILGAIAMPAFTKFFGVMGYDAHPADAFLMAVADWRWLLLVGFIGLNLGLEYAFPDPDGPRAKSE